MKNRKNIYREVSKLPRRAVTIAAYATSKGYETNSYIYHEWRRHVGPQKKNIDFEIVVFQKINFVIPKIRKKVC